MQTTSWMFVFYVCVDYCCYMLGLVVIQKGGANLMVLARWETDCSSAILVVLVARSCSALTDLPLLPLFPSSLSPSAISLPITQLVLCVKVRSANPNPVVRQGEKRYASPSCRWP